MKKIIISLLFIVICTQLMAHFSLGLSVGLPGKITTKYQFTERFGIDFSLASFVGDGLVLFAAHSDLLFYSRELLVKEDLSISAYGGLGTSINTLLMAGVRVPFGIQMPITFDNDHKMEVFFELAPEYTFFLISGVQCQASLGARYVF